MDITEPPFRCGKNEEALAALFQYTIEAHDQDWTYIVAEPERLEDYLNAYDTTVTNEDTKFSLMEMIIQALNDQESKSCIEDKWSSVEYLLLKDFHLHEYTIFYWCCWDDENVDDCFEVTPWFRKLWIDKGKSR